MSTRIWLSIIVMGAVTIAIRLLPLTLIRRPIKGGGIPIYNEDGVQIGGIGVSGGSVAEDTSVAEAGLAALAVGAVAAWYGANMVSVAALCCVVAFVLGLL